MPDRAKIDAALARMGPPPASMAGELTPTQRRAPRKEIGAPGEVLSVGVGFGGGAPSWGYFADDREYAPELQWPQSTTVYERMETDAQLKGLLLATTLPIRRFRWELDPNDADPAIVAHISEDLNLPIRGAEPTPKRRGGVRHDRHLAHALRALSQGHYHFEEVYELRDDGLLHLRKLGTRPPRSIVGIRTDEHGDLLAIEQMSTGFSAAGGLEQFGTRLLEANRLLTYRWDTADDGDQVGRSILRSCYREWLVKDRLIRVDAVKQERNGMGIPWFETDPSLSSDQLDSLALLAEEVRAGTTGGGAGPGKLRIAGTEGTLPDTMASIRYYDEAMAKSLMLLLFNLGGGAESGARALGETFADWYLDMQGAIADWYIEQTQALIERIATYNWGPDEQVPVLAYTRVETAELAFADLAEGVDKGLIAVDEDLRAYIGERFKLPGQVGAPTPAPAAPAPTPEEPDPEPALAAAQPARSALAEKMAAALRAPMTWPELARAVGSDPKNGTARRARDLLLAEGAIRRDGPGAKLAPALALAMPDRDLKREPLPFEIAAGVNFAAMEDTFLEGREQLVDAYRQAQAAQVDELVAEVEAAGGDAVKLATLRCEPVAEDALYEALLEIAEAGVASARAERDAQVNPKAVALAEVAVDEEKLQKTVRERAEATALTLAAGLAASASKRAAAVSALAPDAAAAAVRDHLEGLTDAALTEQLGGATQQAYNSGRRAYMAESRPKEVWASEILDGAACANCSAIDGTTWATLAEAEVAYPLGGYVDCEGGLRCRGTLVAVY